MPDDDRPPGLVDPARQFLGALMHLPAPVARRLLAGIQPDDLPDPPADQVLALAGAVVAAGRAPTPVALFDHARETTDTSPRTGGGQQLAQLGRWLADTYTTTALPNADHAQWLKAVLLRQAWRRAVAAHATRLLQAAEQCGTTDLHRIATDTRHADELWARYLTAAGVDPAGGLEVAA